MDHPCHVGPALSQEYEIEPIRAQRSRGDTGTRGVDLREARRLDSSPDIYRYRDIFKWSFFRSFFRRFGKSISAGLRGNEYHERLARERSRTCRRGNLRP